MLATQRSVDRDTTHTLLGPAPPHRETARPWKSCCAPGAPGRSPPRFRRPRAAACRGRASPAAWPAPAALPPSAGPSTAPGQYRGRNRPGASAPGPLDTGTSRFSYAPPRFSLWTKVRKGSGNALSSRCPSLPHLAPICRSTGVAPICRSLTTIPEVCSTRIPGGGSAYVPPHFRPAPGHPQDNNWRGGPNVTPYTSETWGWQPAPPTTRYGYPQGTQPR